MRIPIAFLMVCPKCKEAASVTILHAGPFMLADSYWRCPYCKEVSQRTDIEEFE